MPDTFPLASVQVLLDMLTGVKPFEWMKAFTAISLIGDYIEENFGGLTSQSKKDAVQQAFKLAAKEKAQEQK